MARMNQLPIVLREMGPFTFAKRVWEQVKEDDIFTWAAALAYSWMFAIFPFLIFLLSLVPLMPARAKAEAYRDLEIVVDKLPTEAAAPIKDQVRDLLERPRGGLLSVGLLITLWAAAGGTSMTMSAMDRCYDIRAHNSRPYIKQRAVALMLTGIVTTLVLFVLILLPVGTEVMRWLVSRNHIAGSLAWLINVARMAIAILLLMGVLGLIYHFGPSVKRPFDVISPGSVFSLIVWVTLAYLFRMYIDLFGAASYNKTYGTVGGVVILLLFFYIDAVVLLIGAEINSEIDFAMLGLPSDHRKPVEAMSATMGPKQAAFREQLLQKRGENAPIKT